MPVRTRFSRIEIAVLVLVLVLGLYFGLGFAVRSSTAKITGEMSRSAADLSEVLQQRLQAIAGVAGTLARISDGASTDSAMGSALSNDVLAAVRSLSPVDPVAIGRVSAPTLVESAADVPGASGSGLYRFDVIDPVSSAPVGVEAFRAPVRVITAIRPFEPEQVRWLGADLARIPGALPILERSIASGKVAMLESPGTWPLGNSLIFVAPTYRGRTLSGSKAERVQQADEGYFVAIPARSLLEGMPVSFEAFDVALLADGPTPLVAHPHARPSGSFANLLSGMLDPFSHEDKLRIGGQRLRVVFSAPVALTEQTLLVSAGFLAFFLGLFGGAVYFLHASRLAAARIEAERVRLETTLTSITDAIVTIDADGRALGPNPAAVTLLGTRDGDESLHRRLASLFTCDDGGPFDLYREIGKVMSEGAREDAGESASGSEPEDASGHAHAVDVHTDVDGAPARFYRLSIVAMNVDTATPGPRHVLALHDMTGERALTRKLEHLAMHDELTGVANRRALEARLAKILAEGAGERGDCGFLYIDLDQFKLVNDTCGHAAGDRLLKSLTDRLVPICRAGDLFVRLGGDEFGLLLQGMNERAAVAVANRIYAFFQTFTFETDGQVFPVRASLGFVPIGPAHRTPSDVLAAADIACYAAKDDGRNVLRVYSDDDSHLVARTREMTSMTSLRRILDAGDIELHAQPLVATDGSGTRHYELLLRLIDRENDTLIAPAPMIAAAERFDMMREVDRVVVARALDLIAGLPREHAGVEFSVNLSGQSAADPNTADFIADELARTGVAPSRMSFELTETAVVGNLTVAIDLGRRLHALGAKLVLDDFGAGLSSFSYLRDLPIDVLKIDGRFVKNIGTDTVDQAIVAAMVQVARAMDIETVAEFVGDRTALDILRDIGIDRAQGYYLGKPVPLDEALAAPWWTEQDRAA